MAKTPSAKPRVMRSDPPGDSIGDSCITMAEWLCAIGAKGRPPEIHYSGCEPAPEDLRSMIAGVLRSVAVSVNAGDYGRAARLLRELRATDDYLIRREEREARRVMNKSSPPPAADDDDGLDDLYADALRHPVDSGVLNPDRLVVDRWLRDFLKAGPKSSVEVYRRGRAAGFSGRELRNARQRIAALIHRRGYPCRTTWLLRGRQGGKS